jgi:DUF971 family protein
MVAPVSADAASRFSGELLALRRSPTGAALELTFAPRQISAPDEAIALPAGLLWSECRSAAGIMRRLAANPPAPPADLTIIRLAPVGDYAVNIVFSDGHARGIFPFAFLGELAARLKASGAAALAA